VELVEGHAAVEDVDAFVADLDAIGAEHGCAVQAFDARYVAGRAHLERAVALATRAHGRGEGVARERSVEVLLYAAGRRQIRQALEMGVEAGEGPVVVVVDADPEGGDEASAAAAVETLLEPGSALDATDPERVREFFDVGEREERATDASLEELVCERVALLEVEK
jgi:KEOPS complex subunit Cgi121